MYTVIITFNRDGVRAPRICFDRGGYQPYVINNLQDAHVYVQELENAFPDCRYKIMEICDV